MKRCLSILFLLMLLLSACASVAATTTTVPVQAATVVSVPTATDAPPQVIQPAVSNVLFQIIKADGTKFDVTLDAVKVIPLTQLTVEGKVQEGPKLSDVLALAGVTDYTEVTINGSSAPSTLIRTQVEDNTILDFSNRGTMKLATTYIPKANWTKDITGITVK